MLTWSVFSCKFGFASGFKAKPELMVGVGSRTIARKPVSFGVDAWVWLGFGQV